MKCRTKNDYGLPLEKALSKQIYDALQGEVVENIIELAKIPSFDNYHRSILEGHSFKVEEETLPRYYKIFNEIKDKLKFDKPVDFYITGDSSVNAFAIASQGEDPNIINVNSSLIQLMTEDELRFVIGHEMGHLINENASLVKLIEFIYPEGSYPPVTLQYKIRLWQQLSELVADRFGFFAMPDISVCISAFFKMSSGLDFEKMQMNVEVLLEENNKRLEYFKNDKGINFATHPINPIRVQALNMFSKSSFFVKGGMNKKELQAEMDELISILLKIKSSELDVYMSQFIATAGIIISNADNGMHINEYEFILNELSCFHIFPKDYLETIAKLDVGKLFEESVTKIMQTNPDARDSMLQYMIALVMADKEIKASEVDLILKIAQNLLGYLPIETAQIFSQMIRGNYTPNLNSLC